jgi:hypothetical protein
MLTPLRLIGSLLALVVIGGPLAALALFLTAVVASPGTCKSGAGPIEPSLQLAVSFQQKWDQLNNTLDAGQVSSVTFTDDEATSRARLWVVEHDLPVSELFVCFAPEGGSASAKVDVPFVPGDVDVLVDGTLILTGDRPEADIQDIEVGGLPGPLADLGESIVDDLIDDQAEKLELDHDYGISFGPGEMTVSGQP